VAERLGRGLQNLVQRFESARDLDKIKVAQTGGFSFFGRQVKLALPGGGRKKSKAEGFDFDL
jgi:hypothetical protein